MNYAGSAAVFLLFNLCFFALVALTLLRPHAYVYTFLTAFLVLGFWVKVMLHALGAISFMEPVGDFAGSSEHWDRSLMSASSGAVGLIVARLAHLWLTAWRHGNEASENNRARVPRWFIARRRAVWLLTLSILLAVNAANLEFAFFQVGVKPRLLLPMGGHVVLGWLVNIGLALWIAGLVGWEFALRGPGPSLLAPLAEAALSATSAFSRLNFLVHVLPYAMVLFQRRREMPTLPKWRWFAIVTVIGALFAASVVAVFWLREMRYYPPHERNVAHTLATQVPLLLVHRWIGLEGVAAVVAAPDVGMARLREALTEDPKVAARSLFQRAAKANVRYTIETEQLVFLSNAGPIAVLLFSGSLLVVVVGMALVGAIVLLTEELIRWWTGNPFLRALAGGALANVIVQTTFFYLTAIFLIQLWMAVAVIGALQRAGQPRAS
jgi:hypothetical protein